jgi:3-dehydroquinate synthase
MTKLTVKTDPEYDIIIERGVMADSGRLIKSVLGERKIALITDSNVDRLYGQKVMDSLDAAGLEAVKIVFPAGEANKNIKTYSYLLEKLAENGITRNDAAAALGGGVAGDTGGFAAATFLRGIKYVQIPTTYLAAVDSSVGGKTAVDLEAGKNLAGAFWQPSLVICDYSAFETLDQTEIMSGTAEALKCAMIDDISIIDDVKAGRTEDVIRKSVSVKKAVVEADERDTGERQKLNFGHTIGHSIEKLSSFGLAHGIAVAKGMAAEARAAERLGFSDCGAASFIEKMLTDAGYDLSIPYTADEVLKYVMNDKKMHGSRITVVYPDSIGHCSLHDIPRENIRDYVEAAIAK